MRAQVRHASGPRVRNILLTIFLALAVVFGGTHAFAFAHGHGHSDVHAESEHSLLQSDERHSTDQESGRDSPSTEVAHSHVSMGAIPERRGVENITLKTASLFPIRNALALPSLGIAPALEPPSA